MLQLLGDFAEWVDFAYWRSFSGGGSAINGATLSGLTPLHPWEGSELRSVPDMTLFEYMSPGQKKTIRPTTG